MGMSRGDCGRIKSDEGSRCKEWEQSAADDAASTSEKPADGQREGQQQEAGGQGEIDVCEAPTESPEQAIQSAEKAA